MHRSISYIPIPVQRLVAISSFLLMSTTFHRSTTASCHATSPRQNIHVLLRQIITGPSCQTVSRGFLERFNTNNTSN